jgi:hypothetical protein
MALHSAIDVKCVHRPGVLKCTVVPVPARQVGGVASGSPGDVKCACRADSLVKLRGTDVHVPTRKVGNVANCSPPMLDPFLLDGEATPLILDDLDWMKR